ncbi:hypothetical protein K438DRAFT_1805302, partial [Mycena galopus ATCC 62051]
MRSTARGMLPVNCKSWSTSSMEYALSVISMKVCIAAPLDSAPRIVICARCSTSLSRERRFSTPARVCMSSHTVSRLSRINREAGDLARYWTTALVRSWPGFNPRWNPMSAASSMLVVAASALTKNLCSNLEAMSGWCSAALAKVVLPIPPPPRMAILGDFSLSKLRTSSNSCSRPWNILGFAGNIENELELGDKANEKLMKSRKYLTLSESVSISSISSLCMRSALFLNSLTSLKIPAPVL